MRTFAVGLLVALVLLAVATQVFLPGYLGGRVEDRLERGGGSARVSLSGFPALALLASHGGTFKAEGKGLRFDLGERREQPFERLDGFEHVHVDLRGLDVGPLQVQRFALAKDSRDGEYRLAMHAATTPSELARQVGSAAGGPLGGLVGSLAAGVFPGGGLVAIPLTLRADVRSDGGRPDVIRARGSVAGVPAGPLAEIVLAVVLRRL